MFSPDRSQALSTQDQPARRSCAGTACFSVTASSEPGTLPRLAAAFAQRSLVPERWHGVRTPDGELQLDIQISDLEPDVAERIAAKMRSLIDVRSVLLYQKS